MDQFSAPSVYFVVLHWNQLALTISCLESLRAQDYPNFRVIVVDNGSTDGSTVTLQKQFPWVIFLVLPYNVGYSAGNNAGINHALQLGADFILLMNNDTEVDPGMLSHMIAAAQADPKVGVVGPTQYYADPPDVIWGGANYFDWKSASSIRRGMGERLSDVQLQMLPSVEMTEYVDTCAALFRADVLRQIGGMDERFFINYDDHDLCARAGKAGYHVVYVPLAKMWHKVSATMGLASPSTTYYMTRNALLFFWLHTPNRTGKLLAVLRLISRTLITVMAWTFRTPYRAEIFKRRRAANLFALRDFFLRRYGQMGIDVYAACVKP